MQKYPNFFFLDIFFVHFLKAWIFYEKKIACDDNEKLASHDFYKKK
jgi:hypothetical protein